jgi:hypothetical protein
MTTSREMGWSAMSWFAFVPVALVAILGFAVLYALSTGPARK